jgi:predicted nucleic acid-binding protein
MRALRVYIDTCVFGGAFDREFQVATQRFFEEVRSGNFSLTVSALVQDELSEAPAQVSDLFVEMLEWTTVAPISADALDLQQAYMDAGILTAKWVDDALHVAMATVAAAA